MKHDDHLIFEALQRKWKLTSMAPAEAADKFGPEHVKVTDGGLRNGKDMVEINVPVDDKGYDVSENEPHGYPHGMTAIQNLLITQLQKHGFKLTKIHHADEETDAYPTVFMKRSAGAMHNVVEIDGMGAINGAPYKEYLHDLKTQSEDAEDALTYNPMHGLAKTAHEIRDILKGAANDEARTEHIIRMAQIVLGDAKDYAPAEYRKMLEGLIILLNRFIVVPMN